SRTLSAWCPLRFCTVAVMTTPRRLLGACLLTLILASGASSVQAAATQFGPFRYDTTHRGNVETQPKVYLVYWGPKWKHAPTSPGEPKSSLRVLVQALSHTSWTNTLAQYHNAAG